jgi:hypothetical protein
LQASHEGLLESVKQKVQVPAEGTLDGVLVKLSEGSTIAGRVIWPEGKPAICAKVNVKFDFSSGGGMGFLNAQRGSSSSAETNEEGGFRVTGLGKGPFIVECSVGPSLALPEASLLDAPPLVPPDADQPLADAAEKKPTSNQPVLRARATGVVAGTEDLLLMLHPPAGLWGRAVDQSGAPVSDFDATVHQSSSGMFAALLNAPYAALLRSRRRLLLLGPRSGELGDRDPFRHACDARAGRDRAPSTTETDPLVVTPPRPRPSPDRPLAERRYRGRCDGARGERLGGIDAILENRIRDADAVKTDEHGRFRYERLLPGTLTLHAESADWARGPTVPLELVGGETITDVELHLIEGGTLTGEVFDAEGKPAPGRMVTGQMMVDFQQQITTTDGAGTFRMERMPPGSWQVTSMDASADWTGGEDGFDPAVMLKSMQLAQATIIDGQETHVVLGGLPEDPIRVHGRVTHLGEPYRGAMMTFFASGDHPLDAMQFTTVDDQGEYEMTVEGSGDYVVSIAKLSGQPGQQSKVEFPCDIPSGPSTA